MNPKYIRFTAMLLSVVMLTAPFLSCSSTTMIHTMPEGAKVYMNDEFKGYTPYKHEDTAISLTTTEMSFKLDGYQDFYTTLNKNEKVDVGAVVGGIFFVFPFIWTVGYNPSHTYELYPLQP